MEQQTSSTDSPRVIEQQLDRDRQALSASLSALGDKLSIESLFADSVDLIKSNAGPYAKAIDTAVRANPMALGLTAVGLAWLILGRNRSGDDHDALAGTKYEAMTRWEDEGGQPVDPERPLGIGSVEVDQPWMTEADTLRDKAAGLITRIDSAARDYLAPAADLARSRSDVVSSLASDIRRVMGDGLESMSDTARQAQLEARELAYIARLNKGAAASMAVGNHPAITGSLMAAAGAAVACLFPASDLENRVMGGPRDRLVADARKVLDDERARAASVGRALIEALKSDVDRVQDRIVQAAAEAVAPPPSGPGAAFRHTPSDDAQSQGWPV